MHDLDRLAAPFRDLIRRKANASHLPNTILFGGDCSPYSLQYHDLMHHTLKDKESTMLRMLSGTPRSRQTIHSLLSRGYRLISDHCTFNESPLPCPILPHHSTPPLSSQYCWALALIQYLQAASSNLHITPPFPKTPASLHVTQTFIHSFFSPDLDSPLTITEVHEFESSYHLYFAEELFSYPPQLEQNTAISILPLFPRKFANFLRRIITAALSTSDLSLGTIVTRDHIIVQLPDHSQPVYIEGLIAPTSTSQPSQALIRKWTTLKNRDKQKSTKFIRLPHTDHLSPSIINIPINTITTARLLHSAIGYTSKYATCKTITLQQRVLPRLSTSLSTTYAQPQLSCNFNPDIITTCKNLAEHPNHNINIYTDGSLKPPTPPNSLLPTYTSPAVHTSLIFSSTPSTTVPWSQRNVTAIRLRFPTNTTANNYTAEILGVATAASLPLYNMNIYTDAKGIVTSINKTLNQYFTNNKHTDPQLPRNYTETGLLYKHIVHTHHNFTLHHIKAHQEDSHLSVATEHGTGNRIADLVAQGDIHIASTLCQSLQVHNYTLDEIIQSPPLQPLISIGSTSSSHDFSFHHPNVTAKAFHINCINHWLTHVRPRHTSHSNLQWEDLTWNLAGNAITKHSKTPQTKLFLFKTLYNALPNAYTKYKYTNNTQNKSLSPSSTSNDLPLCPLCSSAADSLSHLICSCPHPNLTRPRNDAIHQLRKLTTATHPTHPNYIHTKLIMATILSNFTSHAPDHRTLLGLLHTPSLTALPPAHLHLTTLLSDIINITAPYIAAAWKIYNRITHPNNTHPTPPTQHTLSQSSSTNNAPQLLLIISGNNGTLSVQPVQDHPPRDYKSTRRKRHSRPPPPSTLNPHQPPITKHFGSQRSRTLPQTSRAPNVPPTPCVQFTPLPNHTTITTNTTINTPTPSRSSPSTHAPQFSSPKYPFKLPQPSPPKTTTPHDQGLSIPYTNSFRELEVFDPPPTEPPFPPHQHMSSLLSPTTTTIHDVFHNLSLVPHDVPQNGDCFYLAIQLFITQHYDPPILASVPFLRDSISALLTNSPAGTSILKDYYQSDNVLINTLPSLRPADYPFRDTYAQDFNIAAMATLLKTTIKVFTTLPDSTPILYTFYPYPTHLAEPLLPHTPPSISLWATQAHFQLLLNDSLSLPSLTSNLLPLPSTPLRNTNSAGRHITIKAPPKHNYLPQCPYQTSSPNPISKAFCKKTCHPHCPNHYSAFKTIPHQRIPPNSSCSNLLATAGVSANTPIIEISSTITSVPSSHTVPITPTHHSDALLTHPIIQLMYSTREPNCHLEPILIPEPSPHLKLFVVTLVPLLPYTPLRIRPPPEPPPASLPQSLQTTPGTNSLTSKRSLITSYFHRLTK